VQGLGRGASVREVHLDERRPVHHPNMAAISFPVPCEMPDISVGPRKCHRRWERVWGEGPGEAGTAGAAAAVTNASRSLRPFRYYSYRDSAARRNVINGAGPHLIREDADQAN